MAKFIKVAVAGVQVCWFIWGPAINWTTWTRRFIVSRAHYSFPKEQKRFSVADPQRGVTPKRNMEVGSSQLVPWGRADLSQRCPRWANLEPGKEVHRRLTLSPRNLWSSIVNSQAQPAKSGEGGRDGTMVWLVAFVKQGLTLYPCLVHNLV